MLPVSLPAERHGRTLGPCHSQGCGHICVHGHHSLPAHVFSLLVSRLLFQGERFVQMWSQTQAGPQTSQYHLSALQSSFSHPRPLVPRTPPGPGLPLPPPRLGPLTLSPEGQMGVPTLPCALL